MIQIKRPTRMGRVRPSASCFTCQNRDRSAWCTLTDDEMKVLSGHKVGNTYAPGQVIFYEGNPCLGIHCIEDGSVALRKGDASGEPVVVGLRGPGDTLGYLAYFSGRGYSSTAVALTDSRICFVDRAVLRTLLLPNPALGLGFLKKMAGQVADAEADLGVDHVHHPLGLGRGRLGGGGRGVLRQCRRGQRGEGGQQRGPCEKARLHRSP